MTSIPLNFTYSANCSDVLVSYELTTDTPHINASYDGTTLRVSVLDYSVAFFTVSVTASAKQFSVYSPPVVLNFQVKQFYYYV